MYVNPVNASIEALSIPTPTQPQRSILITMAIMAIVIAIFWNVKYLKSILYPFKLITVAFHEFGHAFVGLLTGAKIVSIGKYVSLESF